MLLYKKFEKQIEKEMKFNDYNAIRTNYIKDIESIKEIN